MQEKKYAKKITLIRERANKYWIAGSVLFFLFAASVYLFLIPPRYKVTTRVLTADREFSNTAIEDIKSKSIVQKALDQLPLTVNYYRDKKELPNDSLPVKFTLLKNNATTSSEKLTVTVLDNLRYQIEQNDTLSEFFFNRPSSYGAARFIGVKGPAFGQANQPFSIKFSSHNQLLWQYYSNLDAKFTNGGHNAIELSVTTGSQKDGKDFLNKLIEVYTTTYKDVSITKETVAPDNDESLQKIGSELAMLKLKAAMLSEKRAQFASNAATEATADIAKRDKELNTLTAIVPYAKKVVGQITPVPDSYQVSDSELRKLIGDFNKTESDKKRVLQAPQSKISEIIALNHKLDTLKKSILQRIDFCRNQLANTQPGQNIASKSSAFDDSIISVNNQLKAKQATYNRLLRANERNKKAGGKSRSQTTVKYSEEPVTTYPKTGYVYLFALLTGLVLPLLVLYFRLTFHQEVEGKTLDEKLT